MPEELRPENRFWGKLRAVVNGKNPYPKGAKLSAKSQKYKETTEKNEISVVQISDKSTIQQLDISVDEPSVMNLIMKKANV